MNVVLEMRRKFFVLGEMMSIQSSETVNGVPVGILISVTPFYYFRLQTFSKH